MKHLLYRFLFGVCMNFASQEDKDAFLYRLGEARRILKQPDNTALLSAMLDLVLATPSPATSTGPTVASSFMETAGTYNVQMSIVAFPLVPWLF